MFQLRIYSQFGVIFLLYGTFQQSCYIHSVKNMEYRMDLIKKLLLSGFYLVLNHSLGFAVSHGGMALPGENIVAIIKNVMYFPYISAHEQIQTLLVPVYFEFNLRIVGVFL